MNNEQTSTVKRCPACGSIINPSDTKCPYCGYEISASTMGTTPNPAYMPQPNDDRKKLIFMAAGLGVAILVIITLLCMLFGRGGDSEPTSDEVTIINDTLDDKWMDEDLTVPAEVPDTTEKADDTLLSSETITTTHEDLSNDVESNDSYDNDDSNSADSYSNDSYDSDDTYDYDDNDEDDNSKSTWDDEDKENYRVVKEKTKEKYNEAKEVAKEKYKEARKSVLRNLRDALDN